jgi:hypothetical protein
MSSKIYWASEPDPKKLATSLREKIDNFRNYANTSGRRQLWGRAARMLYGLDPDGGFRRSHYVTFEGAQGQDMASRANIFRALIKSQHVIITGSRPAFNCRPIAYDADANDIVLIGDAWLDKRLDDDVEPKATEAGWFMEYMGEGWLASTWDDVAGTPVGMRDVEGPQGELLQAPMCTGAIRTLALRPDQVIRDPDVTDGPKAHRWLAIAVQRDRWELMAQFPAYARQIRDMPDGDDENWIFGSFDSGVAASRVNGDVITTYELYHRKTLSMPQGLSALLVGDCIVSRAPLPYEDLPLDPMVSDREPNSACGYAEGWDIMAQQSVADSIWMQMSSNRENFGRPNLFMYTGTTIDPYDVGGTRLITGAMPPEVIDLSTGGIESGERMMAMTQGFMQLQSGINDATLGQESGSASGVALAQQQQTAVAFNGPSQLAYVTALQSVMRKQLLIAQRFMTDEQLIHIAGKNRAPVVKRFKAADFRALEGVSVELGSAAMRTAGSRHVIANEMLTAGVITNPETYLEMIATGRLEPALDGPRVLETQADRLMVEVQEGRAYQPSPTMPHAMMVQRLALLIADPSMSTPPELDETGQPAIDPATGQPKQNKAELAMQLVMQHVDLWNEMSMTPQGVSTLAATGQTPAPGAQMMMAQQAAMMAPPGDPNADPNAPAEPGANPDVAAPQNAPQPSPSGQGAEGAAQPALPEGAMPIA